MHVFYNKYLQDQYIKMVSGVIFVRSTCITCFSFAQFCKNSG